MRKNFRCAVGSVARCLLVTLLLLRLSDTFLGTCTMVKYYQQQVVHPASLNFDNQKKVVRLRDTQGLSWDQIAEEVPLL